MADAVADDFAVESNGVPAPAEPEPPPDSPPAAEPPADPPGAPDRESPDGVAEPPGTGDEAPDGETDAAADASEAGRQLAKKKRSLQDALKQETWEKHEARRRAAELEARLAALEGKAAPSQPKQAFDPDGPAPSVDQFESYEEFVDARAAWRAHQEYRAIRERDERERADRAFQSRLSDLERAAIEKHADFVPVMEQFAQTGRSFAANPFIHRVILEHEQGHDVAYALAADPALFDRIHGARTFAHAAAEMGKLLARLETAPTGSVSPAVTLTRAKAPVSPVGSSPVAAEPDADSLAFEDFVRRENEKERASRRR